MKNLKLFKLQLLSLFLLYTISSFGQEDEFTIGMFGLSFMTENNLPVNTTTINGNNSSHLNVLSEDGFNVVSSYKPDYWSNLANTERLLDLLNLNNMKLLTNTKDWYKLDSSLDITINGTNHYNSTLGDHPNDDLYFDNVYNTEPYKSLIWGHQITEESALFNERPYTFSPPMGGWPPTNFFPAEIPLDNVFAAMIHFNDKIEEHNLNSQKLIFMEAMHGKAIHSGLILDAENNNPKNPYTPNDLLEVLNDVSFESVFFEGSYAPFPDFPWFEVDYSNMFDPGPENYHYLGTFKSIDFAKSKVKSVHDVLYIKIPEPGTTGYRHINSDPAINNANWFWFKAYNSIIHGVDGIWFWDLGVAWENGLPENWIDDPERYNRNKFPPLYKNYISHLSKELRYLANKGFLNNKEWTELYTKTDHTDPNCIVPKFHTSTYAPVIDPLNVNYLNGKEEYGLRYTIRTNGDDVIMIISNPMGSSIPFVTLDFSGIGNEIIKNSSGVQVLFESNPGVTGPNINDTDYKTDRESNIDLELGTVGKHFNRVFTNDKKLNLTFGPMDVHVLKFVSDPLAVNDNGWTKNWSNDGNGDIFEWSVDTDDEFYAGDFNGDGKESLLCVQNDPTSEWMTMLSYNGESWDTEWTNYGEQSVFSNIDKSSFNVGDFNGDGSDEIIGLTSSNKLKLFKYNPTSNFWSILWADLGNHSINPYSKNIVVGDYDGDGKDEILGSHLPNGWTTMFHFDQSSSNDFVWGWSDYGQNHEIRDIRSEMISADFNGNGRDEILGFAGSATIFRFHNNDFESIWSNNGGNNFNGWTYPLDYGDVYLTGNIDNVDQKDEILFIQRGPDSFYGTSMDLIKKNNSYGWSWNWSTNGNQNGSHFDDWKINFDGASSSKYLFIKAETDNPSQLLAFKNFGCVGEPDKYLISMYESKKGTNKMVDKNTKHGDLTISPNPHNGAFSITFDNSGDDSKLFMEIHSISGKLVKEQIIYKIGHGSNSFNVDIHNEPNGYYLITLQGESNFYRGKTIKFE